MGSLDEIEESERWKLRSSGSAMDLRSVVVMVVCVCEFLKSVGLFNLKLLYLYKSRIL